MISTLKTLVTTFGLAALVLVAVPMLAGAAPVDVLKDCSTSSTVCQGTNSNTLFTLLGNIINLLLTLIGIISVIMIVIGGIRYTTSAGDSKQVTDAKNTVLYAIVGLVVAVMAFAIVNWVLGKL